VDRRVAEPLLAELRQPADVVLVGEVWHAKPQVLPVLGRVIEPGLPGAALARPLRVFGQRPLVPRGHLAAVGGRPVHEADGAERLLAFDVLAREDALVGRVARPEELEVADAALGGGEREREGAAAAVVDVGGRARAVDFTLRTVVRPQVPETLARPSQESL
jgi:hypothetical protein